MKLVQTRQDAPEMKTMTMTHITGPSHTPPQPCQPVFSRLGLPRFGLSGLGLLCGLALLGGCAASNPSEETFPAPDYSYLPPLNLNVSQVDVSNHTQPGSDDLTTKSPTNPADTLALMAHQRLHATGSSGKASFFITRAEMTRAPHHSLSGSYTVRLSVDDQSHNHHGHITAHVQRVIDAPGKLGLEHNLHTLNTKLMDDMNVELEYQVRSHLASWLTDATGTPLNGGVQSQDLTSTTLPDAGTATQQAGSNIVSGASNSVSQAGNQAASAVGNTTSNAANTLRQHADDSINNGAAAASSSLRPHSPPPGILTLPRH